MQSFYHQVTFITEAGREFESTKLQNLLSAKGDSTALLEVFLEIQQLRLTFANCNFASFQAPRLNCIARHCVPLPVTDGCLSDCLDCTGCCGRCDSASYSCGTAGAYAGEHRGL